MINSHPVLVIGASGLVGEQLIKAYSQRGIEAIGTSHREEVAGLIQLDITVRERVMALVRGTRPQTVLLAAALTNVDLCEEIPDVAARVNVTGVMHVAQAAGEIGARLVYLSTDYVFDGQSGPYREEDVPRPLSQYGWQKLQAEKLVGEILPRGHLIIRTTGVFGWEHRPRNFVARLVLQSRAGRNSLVANDQFSTPTYAPNLAAAVTELERQGQGGIINVAGTMLLDRYSLALMAAEVFGLDRRLIHPASTETLRQTAARPRRGGLLVDKALSVLRHTKLMSAREGLETMKQAGHNKGGDGDAYN